MERKASQRTNLKSGNTLFLLQFIIREDVLEYLGIDANNSEDGCNSFYFFNHYLLSIRRRRRTRRRK